MEESYCSQAPQLWLVLGLWREVPESRACGYGAMLMFPGTATAACVGAMALSPSLGSGALCLYWSFWT